MTIHDSRHGHHREKPQNPTRCTPSIIGRNGSGKFMMLACAVNVDPDILIVDEVLAA